MTRRKKSNRPKRAKNVRRWTLPTTLGLLISVIGALGVIELRPQIKVIPDPLIEPGQPFSTPFRVENTGYSSLYVDRVFFCVRHLQVGRILLRDSVMSDDSWANLVLDRGQAESISPRVFKGEVPDEADVVLAIDTRPGRLFPRAERRYFRFTRFEGPYFGIWTWLQQPSRDVQADVDQQIERWKDEHQRQSPPDARELGRMAQALIQQAL